MVKNNQIISTTTRPFEVGEVIYNTNDVYLEETAGYGGKQTILPKDTKSVVKKYHYNKELYMALGSEKTYYDIAWTKDYQNFTNSPTTKERPTSKRRKIKLHLINKTVVFITKIIKRKK